MGSEPGLLSAQSHAEREATDGMADNRSLTVRLGIRTSFCATTLVTPSFVTVFMTQTKGEKKRGKEKKSMGISLAPRDAVNRGREGERQKNGAKHGELHFMGSHFIISSQLRGRQ